MSTHRHIDRICCVVLAFTLLLSAAFIVTGAFGAEAKEVTLGYETRLFDTAKVHSIDIVMNDWEGFIQTCAEEEYSSCSVVIDGEVYQNVAIRAKGNTSLSNVQSMNSERYSFKIEFDHYDETKTYHGLDKLCLNNIIQDNTYMKDYLTYQMMNAFGVASPLCSYAEITVNGEIWGLYLAVEAVEESFLLRNYGSRYGELYKPDSADMGGGRGNGKDFDIGNIEEPISTNGIVPQNPFESGKGDMTLPEGGGQIPEQMGTMMGSDDVSLVYSDDRYSSYANIFDNAKTDIGDSDKDRLIAAIKAMNEQNDLPSCVDIETVIRYFVVHNFVVNFDSYTGSMIHNYYLYESDGQLSMIPWDYNLAFGGFDSSAGATSLVNYPIDSPVSGGTVASRPMLAWIFAEEEYTEMYHDYFSAFLADYFESGQFTAMMASVKNMISPYVESDPSKFCTYEEFVTGIDTLQEFCLLRAESIRGQLEGSIGATSEEQTNQTSLVNADHLSVSAMGTMGNAMGGNMPTMPGGTVPETPNAQMPQTNGVVATAVTVAIRDDEGATEGTSDGSNDSFGQMPPDMPNGERPSNGTQSGNRQPFGNPQGGEPTTSSSGSSIGSANMEFSISKDMILLLVSVSVLAVGILFAALFKRRK